MLADIQRTVYSEKVIRQLHVMVQVRESSPVIDRRSNNCATPATVWTSSKDWISVYESIIHALFKLT